MSGQDIIDFIIQSKLFQAQHAPDGSKACLVVWSPAAADQLDAFINQGAAMRDRVVTWVMRYMEEWHGPRAQWADETRGEAEKLMGVLFLFAKNETVLGPN